MSTRYFPQLGSGALAQYPITRRWSKCVVTNMLPYGGRVVMARPAPPRFSWELHYQGLSDTEWGDLQAFFCASAGRFGTFTFVDPSDNLLAWTDDLTNPAWTADPMLQVTKPAEDPRGGSNAAVLTNGGQAAQRLMQRLAGPGWFQYCFSMYACASSPCTIDLMRSSAGVEARTRAQITTAWTRIQSAGSLTTQSEEIQFGIELAPSASIFVYGLQVEAQPCAGSYKPKADRDGVYSKSRFDQDRFEQVTDAAGKHSTRVRITATY